MQTLIVDDEEDMRFLLRTTIEIANDGLEVSGEAANGSEALEKWRTGGHDVVVIDQRMPGLTGLQVCEQILAERPDQPIVLFTAFLTDELRLEAKKVGVSECLSKNDVDRLPDALRSFAA